MNIIHLFKNKLDRVLFKKEIFLVAVLIIPILILVAILFSQRVHLKTKIALVSETAVNIPQNDKFTIKVMRKRPPLSDLLLGNYDVFLEKKSTSKYEVTTGLKSKSDLKIIEDFFNRGQSTDSYERQEFARGIGSKIIGCIVMFVLIQGVALTVFYPEDRSLTTFRRILTAPVNENQYIFAQGIFTFLCVFLPTYLAIVITKVCFGIKMGFGLGMLAVVIGILTVLATAFGLFMSTVLKRNISLTSGSIAIATSILTGCFQAFTVNKILDTIFGIFPQKAYMTLIEGVEKGKGMLEFKGQLIYIFIWVVTLWFLGSFISRKKVQEGVY